jgi:hypothetical protein
MMVVILVHDICHNDPLLPLLPAIPISLAVVWDVTVDRQTEQYSNLSNITCQDQVPMKDQFSPPAEEAVSIFNY